MITLKQYAKLMNIHWQTAYNWWHAGKIPGTFLSPSGRFYIDEMNQKNFFVSAKKTYIYQDIFSSILIRK
jgi:predicted site-specific integrase-resolvase